MSCSTHDVSCSKEAHADMSPKFGGLSLDWPRAPCFLLQHGRKLWVVGKVCRMCVREISLAHMHGLEL